MSSLNIDFTTIYCDEATGLCHLSGFFYTGTIKEANLTYSEAEQWCMIELDDEYIVCSNDEIVEPQKNLERWNTAGKD